MPKKSPPLRIADLDLSASLAEKKYDKRCGELQLLLVGLQRIVIERGLPVCLVFEGMDAAGKGGAIKRLTEYLDPRGLDVHAIGPPNIQEKSHHYLRRFWLRLPAAGRIAIFDRSWYGRVLVEPIEGFCTPEEYARAARQIREFEQAVAEEGTIILKFWLHVDKDEQIKRFREREKDPLRIWKIGPEDYRNREKFDQYVEKADAMFKETHKPSAPWILVPGNDKRYARVKVLESIVAALEGGPPKP